MLNNYGFRSGEFKPNEPAETLSSKGIGLVKSRVGLLGIGYYFVGTPEEARSINSSVGHGKISKIDLSDYRLYRPDDANGFYENIRDLTKYFNEVRESDLQDPSFIDSFNDAAEIFSEYLGIDLEQVKEIFMEYIGDVLEGRDGVLLSNRLLTPLGYDGIDLRDTQLDHFGVGSLIFAGRLIDGTYGVLNESRVISYLEFINEKKSAKINPAYLTKDKKEMMSEIKKQAKKEDSDPTAYTSHPNGGWRADYSKSGKRYKTKPSKYTLAYAKKYGTK